ncbi:MAG: general stress protein [Fimbriimonas sp.]
MTETLIPTDHSVAIFPSHEEADRAIKNLIEHGFSPKMLSIIGQDYRTEEKPIGFINTGARMMSWGKNGAFWGTIWGLLFGSAFMFVPGIGYLMMAGYIIGALEGAFIGGSLGVLTAALMSLGIPDHTIMEYESALRASNFLLIIHGTADELTNAQELLSTSGAKRFDTFSNLVKSSR